MPAKKKTATSAKKAKGWVPAVEELVAVATGDADDTALRRCVNAVVDGFDAKDAASTKKGLGLLAKAAEKTDGRAAQVIDLVIGAVVEGGASPELAWPAVSKTLPDLLVRGARFARACVEKADAEHLEDALASAAASIAQERPRDAGAWRQIPARCLAAVACLARSPKLRKKASTDKKLAEATAPLVDAVDEVGVLVSLLRMIDGETVICVHPKSKTAVRITLRDVVTNLELVVLAGAALKLGSKSGKTLKTKLDPTPWPEDDGDWLEAMPADLPDLDGARILILRDLAKPRSLPLEGPVPGLDAARSDVKLMKPDQVEALLRGMQSTPRRPRARSASRK